VPKQQTKDTAPLYLEIPKVMRDRLDAFVERTRRTLKGEVTNAIEQYLDREERLFPPPAAEPEKKGKKGHAPK
jgi:hypothetical protein